MSQQATENSMMVERERAEVQAVQKGHRFTERSWKVDGNGIHVARCSTPGCRAEIRLKKDQYFGKINAIGSAFSSDCPHRPKK